ncbi:proton-translocating NADH-quinone oxidoreductase subunit L [Acetobacter aceti NRIC 0242]|uniref:NADH-quinone oxidoreductase subunit L n=1 Tax=Acetobacter aceti NBRC 14818 TaxID=887700 RepID=A0AB33IB66_ACEAC|nr:NADH-quinone oxidoreductase subunit L [Acetobacter aceti]TCS34164.1 NADH dehydrogenase subunit L [Acetobacter aceti NBRC 14818]BCK75550.1 NADH-quinone oxidoreductase subunit L [Acetobacter aceti NBRC 14818]GAN56687.1 NADH-quinone oxidoreductase subunit L [Acetobacter aceti NBRC 14818]GBO79799.1 proton-translocating NADH-quinone oxidoreductase subunit L [Acetobacter aceti NRIC 0242]
MQAALILFSVATLAPLCGSAIAGLFGRRIGDGAAQAVTVLCMLIATLCSYGALMGGFIGGGMPSVALLAHWVDAGSFHVNWALRFDTLSVTMVAMVLTVSTLVHIYSIGYMSHDTMPRYRFFSYLSLFTFAMLMLVTSNDLIQLFFGWEGVGLASYLLIGYWYQKPSACAAAIKAFVVNRIADLFFLVGIGLIFVVFGTVQYDDIFATVPDHVQTGYYLFGSTHSVLEVIATLLFIGAMGKSAQLFLHTWLPDAMEGPTPVSALIHAATMVTAGVFLMARMSPLVEFAPDTRIFIVLIGATTCFFAATVGLVQPDIKRTIAYSTCSQLGYMFMAIGVGAYQAAVFHLTTHAFFKAMLFLGAGCVIHAMHDEQDMFRMGGLWKKIPVTYAMMWIGSLALAGVFPFAGYWSKDAILNAAWVSHSGMGTYGWILGTVTAFITALYSWRLIFLVFHGKPRDQHAFDHAHESPAVMLGPVLILSVGALVAGAVLAPLYIGGKQEGFWGGAIFNAPGNTVMASLEDVPTLIGLMPSIVGLLGIALAYVLYIAKPELPGQIATSFRPVYQFLLNKWYFDELYDVIFIKPYRAIARALWHGVDEGVIEKIPVGLAEATRGTAVTATRTQTGSIAIYAFTMLVGLVVFVTTVVFFQ